MRITILIISILFSVVGFGQGQVIDGTKLYNGNIETTGYMSKETYDKLKYLVYPVAILEQDTIKTPLVDSMDLKVISMNEFKAYMERIDLIIQKQFDLTKASRAKYEQIINAMNSVYAEADKKRKMK